MHISDVQCVDNHSTELFKSFFGDAYIVQLVIYFDKKHKAQLSFTYPLSQKNTNMGKGAITFACLFRYLKLVMCIWSKSIYF